MAHVPACLSDDIMSFANPDYDGQFDHHGDHLDNENEHEYQQLLDTHYKELSLFSPSPTFHTKDTDGGEGFESQEDEDEEEQSESIFKALDEFYVKSDNLQRRRSRHAYPDINIDDMGFKRGLEPDLSLGSPSFSSNRDESLPLGWEKHEGTLAANLIPLYKVTLNCAVLCYSGASLVQTKLVHITGTSKVEPSSASHLKSPIVIARYSTRCNSSAFFVSLT